MLKKLSDSIVSLSAAQDMATLKSSLDRAVADLGFVSFNLSWNKRHAAEFMEDPVLTSWSKADLLSYAKDGWAARDPLLTRAVEETRPFLWSADAWQRMGHSEYADYLRANGIHGGVTIPLGQEPGELGAMTLLSVTGAPLNTDVLHASTALAHHLLVRARSLREGFGRSRSDFRRLQLLSDRQREILRWVAQGKTNGEISVIMGGTRSTINYHMEEIRRKLGVTTRVQASAILTGAEPHL